MTTTTIKIPEQKGEAIGDWLIARFLEKFGNDKLIQEYLSSNRRQFDKTEYVKIAIGEDSSGEIHGVISVADYQQFLDELRSKLPKKYRKGGSAGKPGFDNVIPMVDMGMGPFTFEAAEKFKEEKALATKK